MSKTIDILIGIVLSIFLFNIWVYKMIITGDIPVSISSTEVVSIIKILLINLLLYILYAKRTSYIFMNLLLLLPVLFLWIMTLKQALTYNYSPYDTLVDTVGSFVAIIIFIQFVYKKAKLKKYSL